MNWNVAALCDREMWLFYCLFTAHSWEYMYTSTYDVGCVAWSCILVKVFGDYHNGLNETLQGIVTLEGSEGEEEEEEEEEEEGEEEREGEERVEEEEDREGEEKVEEEEEEEREGEEKVEEEEQREGEEIEGEEERERVVLVLKKAQETVKEVQQLLSSGQGSSELENE